MSNKNPSPTSDYVFRWLFSTKGNEDLLIALLNAVIRPAVPITAVVIKNPFNLADYDGSKETILDIKAMDQNGVWYDIEMQVYPHIVYGKRALFYGARVYVDQLERGSDYSKLSTTICIHILGFNYFQDDDRAFRRVIFKDDETNEVYQDFLHLQFYFMELPKFHKDWTQICAGQEQWAVFFKDGEKLQSDNLPAALQSEPAIAKAVAELERIGSDPWLREVYEAQEKKRMIEATQIQYAIQEGEQRGRQEGRQEGRREGRLEGQLDLLTSQMTRRIGEIPASMMARMKGLSISQLNDLAQALFDITSYDDIEAWFTRH